MKPVFKKRLGDIDLLSILANHGNSFDQHLDDLHHLEHDDLKGFFSDVASNQITPLAILSTLGSEELWLSPP